MVIIKKQGEIKKVRKEEFENNYKQYNWEKIKEIDVKDNYKTSNIDNESAEKIELLKDISLEKIELLKDIEVIIDTVENLKEISHKALIGIEAYYESLTVKDIKNMLDENKIGYDSNAKKAELIELLM